MFGPSTSSNGRSTDTPPRCTIAPQPSASRSIVMPSLKSALVNVAPDGTASGNGTISVSRSDQPSAASHLVSVRPRLPDAPVIRTGFAGRSVMLTLHHLLYGQSVGSSMHRTFAEERK